MIEIIILACMAFLNPGVIGERISKIFRCFENGIPTLDAVGGYLLLASVFKSPAKRNGGTTVSPTETTPHAMDARRQLEIISPQKTGQRTISRWIACCARFDHVLKLHRCPENPFCQIANFDLVTICAVEFETTLLPIGV